MSPRGNCRQTAFLVLSSLLLLSSSGCTSVRPSGALPLLSDSTPAESGEVASQHVCTVELRGVGGRSKTVDVPVTEDMRVTDVLEASKASQKYSRANVNIWRKSPRKAHEMVKLEVRFDRESGKVRYDTDYAIHPNDRVVVVEQPFSLFDEAYNSLLGPILGRIGR